MIVRLEGVYGCQQQGGGHLGLTRFISPVRYPQESKLLTTTSSGVCLSPTSSSSGNRAMLGNGRLAHDLEAVIVHFLSRLTCLLLPLLLLVLLALLLTATSSTPSTSATSTLASAARHIFSRWRSWCSAVHSRRSRYTSLLRERLCNMRIGKDVLLNNLIGSLIVGGFGFSLRYLRRLGIRRVFDWSRGIGRLFVVLGGPVERGNGRSDGGLGFGFRGRGMDRVVCGDSFGRGGGLGGLAGRRFRDLFSSAQI